MKNWTLPAILWIGCAFGCGYLAGQHTNPQVPARAEAGLPGCC